MYEYFCAVVVGIVEGLTEYIPVSSTGHMIIVGHMLGFEGTLADLFDVFIQLGAILSVLVVYREKFKFILNTASLVQAERALCIECCHLNVSGLSYGTYIP